MPEQVHILGAARTDFRRNLQKEGKSLRDVIHEAGAAAIAVAGITPADIQSGVVGNFAAGLFTRQLHLGAMLADLHPAMLGIPTMHVEAACASGSMAVLTAAQQIMGGLYDVALVVGAEQQKTMSPADGAEVLGAAADYHREKPIYGQFMFPKLFARIAQIYTERYGLTERQLARVPAKNYAHARLNPLAQMRNTQLDLEQACAESSANPRIAPPLKVSDCSQITDGAAALVLCSRKFLQRLSARPSIHLTGWGTATDHLALEEKDVPDFRIARGAIRKALEMALLTPGDLQGVEVHDCFSISEIIAYELIGLAESGRGAQLLESGATTLPSVREFKSPRSIPVNAGGGLIGDGHPVGATGVRQVAEVFAQLTQSAGARQIDGARRMLTFNMGGSFTTSMAMTWESGAPRLNWKRALTQSRKIGLGPRMHADEGDEGGLTIFDFLLFLVTFEPLLGSIRVGARDEGIRGVLLGTFVGLALGLANFVGISDVYNVVGRWTSRHEIKNGSLFVLGSLAFCVLLWAGISGLFGAWMTSFLFGHSMGQF